MRFRPAAFTVLLSSIGASLVWPLNAQDAAAIWGGTYTVAQAERGRAVVQTHCAECHAEDLTGGEGPALIGPIFMLKWETHSVERLFHKIRDTMPSVGSRDVSESEKLDAVAFILQQNGFPAGSKELTGTSEVLAALTIVPKGGPSPPRAGALVRAIGCLEEAGPGKWTLSQSTEPQITTLEPLTDEQKTSAASAAAGAQTIQLLSVFPSPVAIKGHKVMARGLFIKMPADTRINVMSLESVAPTCGK